MRIVFKNLILIVSLFFCIFAWSNVLQLSCKNAQINYAHQQLILNAKAVNKPQIYVFVNKFNVPILLNHIKNPPGASAGWASKLNPQNASALMLMPSRQKFNMTCAVFNPYQPLDCAKVLKVCEVKNLTSEKMKTIGDFWVVENKPLNKALEAIDKKFNNM